MEKLFETSCKGVIVESEDGTNMTLEKGKLSIEELGFIRVNIKGRGYDVSFRCADIETKEVHPYYEGGKLGSSYNAINCLDKNGRRKCRIMFN